MTKRVVAENLLSELDTVKSTRRLQKFFLQNIIWKFCSSLLIVEFIFLSFKCLTGIKIIISSLFSYLSQKSEQYVITYLQ